MKKQDIERAAINGLKEHYENGGVFDGAAAVQAFLARQAGGRLASVSQSSAARLDLKARRELAADGKYITQPVRRIAHVRNAAASNDVASASQRVALRELAKRTLYQSLVANALAARPGATQGQIRQAVEVQMLARIAVQLVDDTPMPPLSLAAD